MGHFPAGGGGGGGGTVDEITSDDDSVTITDPTGPSVDLSVAGAGGGWPDVDGSGPGNLTAITPDDDTVGYSFTDTGSGGIFLNSVGTGPINFTSLNGYTIESDGDGSVLKIDAGNSGATEGILITTHGTDVGGITLDDNTVGGGLNVNSSNFISLDTQAGSGDPPQGIELTTDPTDVGGIVITEQGTNGVTINTNTAIAIGFPNGSINASDANGIAISDGSDPGIYLLELGAGNITLDISGATGNIVLVGLPTTDPGVPGALYQTAGAVMVSL